MEVIDSILAALLAGAQTGFTEAASESMKDAYAFLKGQLTKKFAGKETVQTALQGFEEDPGRWKEPLKQALVEAGVDKDIIIARQAESIVELARQEQPAQLNQILSTVVGNINAPQGKVTVVGGDVRKIEM